ncbi:MAG TPA: hypothetical protein VMV29_09845 [Ktedonobacterales bacterium]|nr:hypothetical protein [Ktedonobacterales bacterium]
MPMKRDLYPRDWPDISKRIRERAGNRCEWPGCGLANGATVEGKRGPYRVVLTVAHLDHAPANCDPANLRAWCQPHHLRYDANHHKHNAAETRRRRVIASGQMELLSVAE